MLFSLARPLLHSLDPETAHRLTLKGLRALPVRAPAPDDPRLSQLLWGKVFPNPVGLAAGFDKNAEAPGALLSLGFGFVECGTVTPLPQEGNPRPRVFRDPLNRAVINRMGFPNRGAAVFRENVQAFLRRRNGLIGLNIGMNKGQADPAADYTMLVNDLAPLADYLTVNISSPNTPGLRDLQSRDAFLELTGKILDARQKSGARPPLLVKLAPDLTPAQVEDLAAAALTAGIDGLILTNTTLARPAALPPRFAAEKGGLSGAPLFESSTEILRQFYRRTGGRLILVGAGGIGNGDQAYEKIRAGASLVQLYSGLVFQGPGMLKDIKTTLLRRLQQDGFGTLAEAVGADHRAARKKVS